MTIAVLGWLTADLAQSYFRQKGLAVSIRASSSFRAMSAIIWGPFINRRNSWRYCRRSPQALKIRESDSRRTCSKGPSAKRARAGRPYVHSKGVYQAVATGRHSHCCGRYPPVSFHPHPVRGSQTRVDHLADLRTSISSPGLGHFRRRDPITTTARPPRPSPLFGRRGSERPWARPTSSSRAPPSGGLRAFHPRKAESRRRYRIFGIPGYYPICRPGCRTGSA